MGVAATLASASIKGTRGGFAGALTVTLYPLAGWTGMSSATVRATRGDQDPAASTTCSGRKSPRVVTTRVTRVPEVFISSTSVPVRKTAPARRAPAAIWWTNRCGIR